METPHERPTIDELLADLESNAPIPPRREIITDDFTNGPDLDTPGSYTRVTEVVNPYGDIHRSQTLADAAAESQAEWDALDAKIKVLQPVIGWAAMDDLLSRVNALQMAVRIEAIDRMIATARSMVDFDLGIFVAPEPEEKTEGA